MNKILTVNNLEIAFWKGKELVTVVNQINFALTTGKITCLVGQSGSGKSLTGLAISGVLPIEACLISGEIFFHQTNLLANQTVLNSLRGKKVFSIFQNPMNSFNPALTIGKQIKQFAISHQRFEQKTFYDELNTILKDLSFSDPTIVLNQYPFQLSGGMLQRLMIAMAIFLQPELIIADEPTTALDVTVQKEILAQFKAIQKKLQTTLLLITHDFGVVAELADEVLVMKNGMIVEHGNVLQIFDHPKQAYTRALINATFGKCEEVSSC